MTVLSPEPIMRLASGFMAAKLLFAADELGIFEALGDGPATLDGLAGRTGLTPRAARITADAMVALGLIERAGDRYRNGPVADAFLAGRSPVDLRPSLRFWNKISYPAWTDLATALVSGPRQQIIELSDAAQKVAAAGIEGFTAAPSAALADTVDWAGSERLLDVGGGTGSWSIAVVRSHADMRATVVDLPAVADVARTRAEAAGLADRVTVVSADVMLDDLPGGHDVVLVANLVHYFAPEDNRKLLDRIRGAVEPGTRILLADFWTNAIHTEPVIAAMMAGEFATHLRDGDVYSVDEVGEWLAETGWRFLAHTPLAGPISLVTGEALG